MFVLKRYTQFYIDNGISKTVSRLFNAPVRRINKILFKKKDYFFFFIKKFKRKIRLYL